MSPPGQQKIQQVQSQQQCISRQHCSIACPTSHHGAADPSHTTRARHCHRFGCHWPRSFHPCWARYSLLDSVLILTIPPVVLGTRNRGNARNQKKRKQIWPPQDLKKTKHLWVIISNKNIVFKTHRKPRVEQSLSRMLKPRHTVQIQWYPNWN